MTEAAPRALAHRIGWSSAYGWVRANDPAFLAFKRSTRAAVVMPSVFGLTHLLFSDAQVSLFGAFGSFALLLLVEFQGRPRTRLTSYAVLFVVGSCFITLGTVVSTHEVAAIAVMAAVAFGVLFGGIVSPQAASASTAALLTFVLPVAVAQPATEVGPRLVGWLIAGAFSIPDCMVVWPAPWHDNLRRRLSVTLSAVSRLVLNVTEHRPDPAVRAAVTSELSQLRGQFASTPYQPTGTAAGAVAVAKLVGRVEWVVSNTALVEVGGPPADLSPARPVVAAVAETLRLCASLVCDANGHPVDDPGLVQAVQESTLRLERLIEAALDAEVSMLIEPGADGGVSASQSRPGSGDLAERQEPASSLDPTFRARALGIATEMVADAAVEAAGVRGVTDRRLADAADMRLRPIWSRLASHLSIRSVWFRNAVRGAAGLALAVAVVEATNVEHGFWVVLGTLSVLRSNALGTGATALRAVGGTAVGFVVGSAIMVAIGGHPAVLWALLPLAVLVSGVAPSVISFTAGQAGFTLVVVILFNIIDPVGWKVGLTRIEDVGLGCAVSIVVGLLFWPRGATAALGRALSDAFVKSSGYLADAVDRLTTMTHEVDTRPGQRGSHRAYLRLDDAFREFLTERGAKVVTIETVANLFTGSNRIRVAAFTLSTLPVLPSEPGPPELESVAIAGAFLRDSYASTHRWYGEFAEMLADRRDVLDPPSADDATLHDVLRHALQDASDQHRGDRVRLMLRMLWADELLETQRQMQADLVGSAHLFARRSRRVMI